VCLIDLPPNIKVFPVFHNSLLRPCKRAVGLPGQRQINEAESRHLRGRILERDHDTDEMVEKWEFEALLDCHNDYGSLQYLVKWKHLGLLSNRIEPDQKKVRFVSNRDKFDSARFDSLIIALAYLDSH
jgi:hypothetical protein